MCSCYSLNAESVHIDFNDFGSYDIHLAYFKKSAYTLPSDRPHMPHPILMPFDVAYQRLAAVFLYYFYTHRYLPRFTLHLPNSKPLPDHLKFANQLYDFLRYFDVFIDFTLRVSPGIRSEHRRSFRKVPSRTIQLAERKVSIEKQQLFNHVPTGKGGAQCTICLLRRSSKQMVELTACSHQFHDECIRKWLDQVGYERSCPLCRKDIPKEQVSVTRFLYHR